MKAERKRARSARRDQRKRNRFASDPSEEVRQSNDASRPQSHPRSSSLNARPNTINTGCFQSSDMTGRVQGGPSQAPVSDQPSAGISNFLTNPVGYRSDSRYVPHYLKPLGEGATFYHTLPEPWNVVPEHTPTPLTQVPQMQKGRMFH